jgi:hypothetical protein
MFFVPFISYAQKSAIMDTTFLQGFRQMIRAGNLEVVIVQERRAWYFLYNHRTNAILDDFGVVEEGIDSYISLTSQIELNAGYGYQCVGFIKIATDLGATSTWRKGPSVSSQNPPRPGRVIATFNSAGRYNFGHVGLVLKSTPDYVYVLDQNWDGTGSNPVGRLLIHAIPFTGTGLGNAGSYSVVEH